MSGGGAVLVGALQAAPTSPPPSVPGPVAPAPATLAVCCALALVYAKWRRRLDSKCLPRRSAHAPIPNPSAARSAGPTPASGSSA